MAPPPPSPPSLALLSSSSNGEPAAEHQPRPRLGHALELRHANEAPASSATATSRGLAATMTAAEPHREHVAPASSSPSRATAAPPPHLVATTPLSSSRTATTSSPWSLPSHHDAVVRNVGRDPATPMVTAPSPSTATSSGVHDHVHASHGDRDRDPDIDLRHHDDAVLMPRCPRVDLVPGAPTSSRRRGRASALSHDAVTSPRSPRRPRPRHGHRIELLCTTSPS